MPDRAPKSPLKFSPSAERMVREVESKQQRMARARDHKDAVWSSLSIIGVIGWSVVVPTLLGVFVGLWIDNHWPSRFSWALVLMLSGLLLGSANAWLRIRKDQP